MSNKRNSLNVVPSRKPIRPEQLRLDLERGNGTTGPVPRAVPASGRRVPRKIPMNVAFAEVTQFVTAGLNAAGEQWNDTAKQEIICTILDRAARQGLLEVWERAA